MATMTIKNLPDTLYEQLKRSAARHHRSINKEAVLCLEKALRSHPADPDAMLAHARDLRARHPGIFVTDDDLDAAKNAGRS